MVKFVYEEIIQGNSYYLQLLNKYTRLFVGSVRLLASHRSVQTFNIFEICIQKSIAMDNRLDELGGQPNRLNQVEVNLIS